jgi:GDP-D-mannose dehydratase
VADAATRKAGRLCGCHWRVLQCARVFGRVLWTLGARLEAVRNEKPPFFFFFLSSPYSSCRRYVKIDPAYFRPTEVDYLLGDSSKMQKQLGWKVKTTFKQLVKMMVDHDLELARNEKLISGK